MALPGDKTVLNFHDSLLRESDYNLLNEGQWLNDRIIAFVFEYFERVQFIEYADKVAFVSPDVVQLIKMASKEELALCIEPLNLDKKELILMAVNDHTNVETAGGSHWSLVVYHRPQNRFMHFDSAGRSNVNEAVKAGKQVEPFIKPPSQVTMMEVSAPQQNNSCDCGMYVIAVAEQISRNCLGNEPISMLELITPEYISAKRSKLQQLISSLAQQGYK